MYIYIFFFFFKQKTAYEIGTGDWSSDVCSSDLLIANKNALRHFQIFQIGIFLANGIVIFGARIWITQKLQSFKSNMW